jgi:Protein of unknown function (DUF1579)
MTESETQRLDVLAGEWKTEGWTLDETGDELDRIDAIDTYEWLPGKAALLHRVDARVGGELVEGAEIIGYDPATKRYATRYFGSDGPAAYAAELREEGGALVWSMESDRTRFRGTFSSDGGVIRGHWELKADGRWRRWMEITLTKR